MIKYFIKQYGRYIAMALAFATISFLINSCKVNAENEIQTVALGFDQSINTKTTTIFTSTNTLKNWGRSTVVFTLATVQRSANTSQFISTIQEVRVTSGSDIYECNIGSVVSNYSQEENYKSQILSVVCDVNINSSGITKIEAITNDTPNTNFYLHSSSYMTISKNLDISTQAHLDTINSTLATYLQSVYNASLQTATNTGASNNYLSAIQVLLNTNLTAIVQAITNQTTQAHTDAIAQKESTDAINNSINNSDTSNVSLDTLQGNSVDTGAISGLITIPIVLLNNIIASFNGTCISYNFGELFGTDIVFPCINKSR